MLNNKYSYLGLLFMPFKMSPENYFWTQIFLLTLYPQRRLVVNRRIRC